MPGREDSSGRCANMRFDPIYYPDIFSPDEQLGGIIVKLKESPDDHRYKDAIEMLDEINRYTRNFHHAPVDGDVTEDTNVEELKAYCRRVIALTRGTA
jgi:hypothetical protein